ncbi:MAG: PEP-CTERM sorting domain-containing protein [Pirellulales bacterium]|nr:PEP-CTERM sorting domain-containing protein [Pirellulales bacterium]
MRLRTQLFTGALAAACIGQYCQTGLAVMTYDLRFAPGTVGATADNKTVLNPTTGNYAVELYAIIDRNNDTFNDDTVTGGAVNIYSQNTGLGALAAGTNSGVTAKLAVPTPNFQFVSTADQSGNLQRDENGIAQPNAFEAGVNYVSDGILDWGADERYITNGGGATVASPILSGYHREGSLINASKIYAFRFTQPFQLGQAVIPGVSQPSAARANSWEVLVGRFTIAVNGLNPAAGGNDVTSFVPFSQNRYRATSTSPTTNAGANYSQDGSAPNTNPGGLNVPFGPDSFSGVSFVVPEPSTYLMCGLAAFAGLFGLRRKFA